jgi:N-acetylneuraminic acid mutarotase
MNHTLYHPGQSVAGPTLSAILLSAVMGLGAHACGGAARPERSAAPLPGAPVPEAGEAAAPGALAPPPLRHSDMLLMPRPVTSFGATLHDGWLYVLGGYAGQPHQYDREGQSGALQRIRVAGAAAGSSGTLGVGAGTWEDLPGVEPLQSVALVAHRDFLVRVGGMRATNAPGEPEHLVSTAEVARYRPGDARWEPLPPLPDHRSSHDAVVLDGTLYVLGGWRLEGGSHGASWPRDGLALNLGELDQPDRQPRWRSFPVPFQRRGLAVAAVAGRVVAIGGMDPDGEMSRRVDVYDPRTGAWTRGPDYPAPAFGVAAAAVGDRIYASAMDGTVYSLAPREERWQAVTTLAFPRYFHRLQAVDGELLAIGGMLGVRQGGRVRAIERLALAETRAPSIARFTLDAPGPAKNRQGVFLRDSTLYVFGGNRSLEQHDFEPDSFLAEGHKLQLGALAWQPMAEFPIRRQTMQTIVGPKGDAGDAGFAVGGFGHDGKVARTFSETFVYDFEDDAWQPRPGTLPAPRSQFGLAQHQGQLWVFGGLDYDPNRSSPSDEFRHPLNVLKAPLADAAAGFQNAGIDLPQPRRAFGGALLGDRYYLVGGMRENFQLVTSCDVYDFATKAWATIPAPRHTRISPQLVALGGKLYLAGGVSNRGGDDSSPDPSIEVFDPKTGRWSVLIEELPVVTNHMRMLPYGDHLLLYSAHSPDDEVHVLLVHPGSRAGGSAGASAAAAGAGSGR